MTTSLVPVVSLPFLASEVNDAHRQVTFHARSLLHEARRAGEALLAAKKMIPHGGFKTWVEANCAFSYKRAAKYMQVAKLADKSLDHETFDMGIDAFLDAHATKRSPSNAPATAPSFNREDAEYVLKINARAERGIDGEREVARTKLEKIAADHGMPSVATMVARAKVLCPEPENLGPLEAGIKKLMEPYTRLSKGALLTVILKCFATHPDLIDTLKAENN